MIHRSLILLLVGPFTFIAGAQTQVLTDDVTHFWEAYDRITATKDTAEQRRLLHSHFIDKASTGQRGMFAARRYTPDEYLNAIRSYPRYYASVRPNMQHAGDHAEAMLAGAQRLRELYPAMKPADIYFTVGVFRSGGTVMEGNVLIGCENSLTDKNTVVEEFPASMDHLRTHFATEPNRELAFTNVHELVHTQQPGRWGYDVLSQSLHEGIAEFIPTLAMERPSPAASVAYGLAHADTVRAVFERELFAYWIDRWIWNAEGPFPQRDLGYYVGYAMAERYYARTTDKAAAIASLIQLNCEDQAAVEAFADACGYFSRPIADLRAAFEAARPRVTHIAQFANGSTGVDPSLSAITIHFDRPLITAFRSTGHGPLGAEHAPVVSSIDFAADGRSVTYAMKLEPRRHYQFTLEEGYRDERLVQMVPYTVDFSTR